jgi:hypothetical protein
MEENFGGEDMKKIEMIVRPEKLEEIRMHSTGSRYRYDGPVPF